MKILFLFLALSVTACSFAKSRSIGFVQQEQPGELVMITVADTGRRSVVTVRDFRTDPSETINRIDKQKFEMMWDSLNSTIAHEFKVSDSSSQNMSDVGFYTIMIKEGKRSVTLRIPAGEIPDSLTDTIDSIRAYIPKTEANKSTQTMTYGSAFGHV